MSRSLTICSILLFGATLSISQSAILDSLHQELPKQKNESLAMLYLQVAKQYYFLPQDRDSLLHYADLGLQLSTDLQVDHLIQKSLFTKGAALTKVADYPSSILYLLQADSIAKKMKDSSAMITAQVALGNNYYLNGQFSKSMDAYTKAATLGEITKSYQVLAPTYGNIASILGQQERFQEALIYFQKSIQLSRTIQDHRTELASISNAISTYHQLNRLDSSLILSRYLAEKSIEVDYQEGWVWSQIRLAYVHNHLGKHQQAIHYANQLIDQSQQLSPEFLFSAYQEKSIALNSLGQKDEAIQQATLALGIARTTNTPNRYIEAFDRLSNLYKTNHRYDSAFFYLKSQEP